MGSRRAVRMGLFALSALACAGCGASTGTGNTGSEPKVSVVPAPLSAQPPPPPAPSAQPAPTGPAPAAPANAKPASASKAPETAIVQKPKPVIPKVDVAPFLKMGCVLLEGTLDCSKSAPIQAFKCHGDRLRVDDSLGALLPKAAIAECNGVPEKLSGGPLAPPPPGPSGGAKAMPIGIVRLGCMFPIFKRYLVSQNGKLTLVRNAGELAALFAPVESPEEAFSFAVALSKAEPQYTLEIPPGWRAAPRIETSYSEPAAGGYKVHLFEYQLCGCGPHPYKAVDFLVGKDGAVKVTETQEAYADPRRDNLCID